ncbi:Crp/Fnr family transcriptional regulator [Phycicoccus flavus]|uniref:Cyclic nucleotide-binding domain-containing protein n=1 Tax=Phycicoccus flavus TaxID=2502783 RepID=A0A8T6R1A5_9MICO|nr:cyclic nucleotide-binding domain-containing protein [Phycicoccus flavus]NHA67636.1 cyclic nucleotide-binding domain-containing protein [Phycicoccus flavus]
MDDLLALCADLPVRQVAPGEVLLEEGAAAGALLVLQSGSVVVERGGTPFARIDTPGAVFGELAVVLGVPVTATVRADDEVVVRVAEDPRAFLTERPGAALAVLRTTAARLDGLTRYLADVKEQYAGLPGHLGMVDGLLDTLVHHQGPQARPGSARDPEGHLGH